MRGILEEIVSLQKHYSAVNTPLMKRRGELVRRGLPDQVRMIAPQLRAAMSAYGEDAEVEGKDNMGQMARIPWVRWHSKSRSPSATNGWYVVYLFHPDASGVSLCLSHGSTQMDGKALVARSEEEVVELMRWASNVVGSEFNGDPAVRNGIVLGSFDLAEAYERTTVFSKFYAAGEVPSDANLRADLLKFVQPLAALYRAKERGHQPGTPSVDAVALVIEIERITAPLKPLPQGQGRGLTAVERKAVEYAAMRRAKEWLKEHGFDSRDVSSTDSCDFRASKAGQEWVVEVKGTTGGPGSVLLTRKEVELHRRSHPHNALIVVHGLCLSEDRTSAHGGDLMAYSPWNIDEERLSSICYEYRLSA